MRTTREILIAVQEGGVAGVEEMRAALVALGAVNQLLWPSSPPEARERASEGVARSHGFI